MLKGMHGRSIWCGAPIPVKSGEWVLLHAAAGGTGLIFVSVAQGDRRQS